MIEKLHEHSVYTYDGSCVVAFRKPSTDEIMNKINEIIDVVNSFEVVPDILKKDMVLKEEKNG